MANLSYGNSGSSYYDRARRGEIFCAYAIVTAPVAFGTAAATGGPLLWNNTQDKNAVILGVSCAVTVAETTQASALGLTGGSSTAPSATTAIDSIANLNIGGKASVMNLYRVGTVSAAGTFFLPLFNLGTGALTVYAAPPAFVPLEGAVVVGPGNFVSVAASSVTTAAVCRVGLLWMEVGL